MLQPIDPLSIIPSPERICPTMRQLIVSTLVGIGTHPRIKNPGIYFPYKIGGQEAEEIKIQQYRSYGGIELDTPGLTCSVYPVHTSRDSIQTTAVGRTPNYSQMYKPVTLGRNTDATAMEEVTTNLVIELAYQDSEFDRDLSYKFTEISSLEMQLSNHAYHQMLTDGRIGVTEEQFIQPYYDPQTQQLVNSEFVIRSSIGESILTEYMDLMRLVLNDLPTLRPFSVRGAQVKSIDYSTSNWLNKSQNINFHQAYLVWELVFFAPKSWRDIFFTSVKEIGVNGQVEFPTEYILPDGQRLIAQTANFNDDQFLKRYVNTFTQAYLSVNGILVVTHNLNSQTLSSVMIWDNTSNRVFPSSIEIINSNVIQIRMHSFMPITGTWTVIVGV